MSEKNSVLQINFQWEKLARTYLGQIISCNGKKISLMTCGKNLTLYMPGKRGLGKTFLPKPNHPYPPPPQKSNGQPHRGREEADLAP